MAETKRGRLLIVDDEVELMNALCETLADEGYETVGRDRRRRGARGPGEADFDLLLSDLMMPGMDGIQLLRKALEIDPNLVGIIMTGQGTIPTAVEAMKVGRLRLRAEAVQPPDHAAHPGPRDGRPPAAAWRTSACAVTSSGSATSRRATR